jgi:hypothetical protein
MTIEGFGNIMPVHGAILSLIGWKLSRGGSAIPESDEERVAEMRSGHAERSGRMQVHQFEEWDPLSTPDDDPGMLAAAQKREIANILKSYTG